MRLRGGRPDVSLCLCGSRRHSGTGGPLHRLRPELSHDGLGWKPGAGRLELRLLCRIPSDATPRHAATAAEPTTT